MSAITEQIKDRINVADFIGEYIDIKPAGANFKALCPFHKEKTPSFMISASRNMFKCFGCGKGGDIFTFLEEYEGITFAESLKILANRAGVILPHIDKREENAKNRIYTILEHAANFYHQYLLKNQESAIGRQYLENRAVEEMTRDIFKLGYSSSNWRVLYEFLRSQNFSDRDLAESGMISLGERGAYDKFRARLMFPICDEHGRVVGFGGRILGHEGENTGPKYLNTPGTVVYDKSRVLYGLDKAKEAIRKNRLSIIVEGYMDVLASHKAGVANVVAVSGTALTADHLTLLKRFSNTIALAFDMDSAGQEAALRAYQLASSLGLNTKIVQLPHGLDPDDLVRRDKDSWRAAVEQAKHVVDYYFEVYTHGANLSKLEDKKRVRDGLLPLINSLTDSLEYSHYLEKLATLLSVSREELKKYRIETRRHHKASSSDLSLQARRKAPLLQAVEHLFALIFKYPLFIAKGAKLPHLRFKDEGLNNLYKEVSYTYNTSEVTKDHIYEWESKYKELVFALMLLGDKDYAELQDKEVENESLRLASYLAYHAILKEREILISRIREAEAQGNTALIKDLTEKLNQLI